LEKLDSLGYGNLAENFELVEITLIHDDDETRCNENNNASGDNHE
jgi:hypothetical protein